MPAVFSRRTFRLSALLGGLGLAASVLACPSGQQQVCTLVCFCAPISQADIEVLYQDVSQMAASGLEQWLLQSRDSAAAGGTQPIPLHIRAQLEPYYDIGVLDAARYKVGDGETLGAANTMLQNPDVQAVTLIDIIVFRNAADAQDNVALWAHELLHVQQYQQWGVGEFARRYTRNHDAIEAPAYQRQIEVARALRTQVAQSGPAR
ncbi:conserved exported hypothetical protein [Pseudomonas sp. 8AS]|uniref:eCIS core domain-containing protein n=1 Tax=Pseudomonas sp. 8AS TaxID=2653163 RepID=UPI0012F28F36|nr:DUF4157 domain-containing protein [Pseudomonas sp. 8AS]VXB82144.1 conserved exported hypothetical protein [Pseudomonas sp. 8AS]